MSGGAKHWEHDKESTCYIGNLDERITDALVWELCIQAGPVVSVHLPKDRVTQAPQGYGFVEFRSEQDAEYACNILNNIRLHGKPIRVNKSNADKRSGDASNGSGQSIGAELFIGNLDQLVDEKVLYETFVRFGPFANAPKIARDDKYMSKGFGFVSYVDFESADAAIEHMNGQYLMNREVAVQFAYKKDGRNERHGDAAERAIAAAAKKHGVGVAPAALPASLTSQITPAPTAPAPYANGFPPNGFNGNYGRPTVPAAGTPAGYGGYPGYAPPPALPYQQLQMPPSNGMPNGAAPDRPYSQIPLGAPPTGAGLPARPPPSMAGYGGPVLAPGLQPGYQGPPGGPPPGMPPGFGQQGGPPMGAPPTHGR